jgi:hypothetical protein
VSLSAEQWMAASSMAVSLAVLVFGAIQYRAVARKEYVDELSDRVSDCEDKHKEATAAWHECERERNRLTTLTVGLISDMRHLTDERMRNADKEERKSE